MPARSFLAAAAIGLFVVAGCGPAKLDVTKSWDINSGESQMILLSAQPRPQRLTVDYQSDNPIEVGVYKGEDVKEDQNPPVTKALALDKAKTSGTLTVDLNADIATTVVVTALGKKASVKVQVTNRK